MTSSRGWSPFSRTRPLVRRSGVIFVPDSRRSPHGCNPSCVISCRGQGVPVAPLRLIPRPLTCERLTPTGVVIARARLARSEPESAHELGLSGRHRRRRRGACPRRRRQASTPRRRERPRPGRRRMARAQMCQRHRGNNLPAQPGAFECEPLKAASRGSLTRPPNPRAAVPVARYLHNAN